MAILKRDLIWIEELATISDSIIALQNKATFLKNVLAITYNKQGLKTNTTGTVENSENSSAIFKVL